MAFTDVRARDITIDQSAVTQVAAMAAEPDPPVVAPVRGLVRYANLRVPVVGRAVAAGVAAAAAVSLVVLLVAGAALPAGLAAGVGVGLVAGVGVWVLLSLREAHTVETRRARAAVLDPLDLPPLTPGPHTLGTLLAPEHAVAALQARAQEKKTLLAWCAQPGSPVRILAGPGGVGKTRLAVELARALPVGWVAGRCVPGHARHVLPAVLACGDPTLVVVDDADTEPRTAALIRHATTHADTPDNTSGAGAGAGPVKVLLVVRDASAYLRWLHQQPDIPTVADPWPRTELTAMGGAGDRRRWFARAARAYAAALGTPPPPISDGDTRPVGAEGDPMILTQARALLAALGGTSASVDRARTAGVDRVAAEVFEHERRRWDRIATDPTWVLPTEVTADTRTAAVLALVLAAPTNTKAGVALLRRLPALAGQPETLLRNLLAWATHLYPAGAAGLVDPRPDFLTAALLTELTQPARAELLADLDLPGLADQDPHLIPRLVQAAALSPPVAVLVAPALDAPHLQLALVIESVIVLGPTAWYVQPLLVTHLDSHPLELTEATHLQNIIGDIGWAGLQAGLQQIIVDHARCAYEQESTAEARAALATALESLGIRLYEVGEHRRGLTAAEEAVTLYRALATAEPARYTPNLAAALSNLGNQLSEVGEHRAP